MTKYLFLGSVLLLAVSCGQWLDTKESRNDPSSDVKGFGDFRGVRLTEAEIASLMKRQGVPPTEIGRALCTAHFESNFFTQAQHDNRMERRPDPAGPMTPEGKPLRYLFSPKKICLKSTASRAVATMVCTATKNDNLKGYKNTPELNACLDTMRSHLATMKEILAAGGTAAQERARQCSFDYGLFQINDYWGVYGTYPNGNKAPCAQFANQDMFNIDRNIACMVKMARCGRTSCNFGAWHGYNANKAFCDAYRPGRGLP
jgi:hypothetical protein